MRQFALLLYCLLLSSCVSFKEKSLFDRSSGQILPDHIENLYALNIFDGTMNGEQWCSKPPELPSSECLTIEAVHVEMNTPSMLWSWNKNAADCGWMGIGFGWDGWTGKDLSAVVDKAAIQLKVRSKKGVLKSLPLAASLEDFGGNQVWIGFNSKVMPLDGVKDNEWSFVTLPLADFEWENAQYMDISNVKQLIVQFEGSGDLFVSEIKIIPFKGGGNKRIETKIYKEAGIVVDGDASDMSWQSIKSNTFSNYNFKLLADDDKFYFLVEMPLIKAFKNSKKLEEVWNGDALEFAFSTRESDLKKRVFLNSSDRHFGVNLNSFQAWDWTQQKELMHLEVAVSNNNSSTTVELAIPFSDLGMESFDNANMYRFEFAVDRSSSDGMKRESQIRWNSENREGFHTNPSLWGELIFNKE